MMRFASLFGVLQSSALKTAIVKKKKTRKLEHARILVLLQKKGKVKIFITSHSTDMVSAIKYISEKEKVQDKVSFYVANEKSKHKYIHI